MSRIFCLVALRSWPVTATHLKRLFANQDVFNSLDRNVAGLTVTEADEKETKPAEGESEPITQATTPTTEGPPMIDTGCLTQVTVTPEDGNTPIAGMINPVKNPFSQPHTPIREYDSDSTISARPKPDPAVALMRMSTADAVESSGIDSDANAFVSRLPRRSRPTPRQVVHFG